MTVLGIDTSGILGGVALVREGRLIGEARCDARAAASERIIPQIRRLLADLGLAPSAITRLGVAIGPGSFTGLRVGLGTAKGLALGLGIPVVPVPTIAARIFALGVEGHPVLYATAQRRGEVFCAVGLWEEGRYRELVRAASRSLAEAPHWVRAARAAAAAIDTALFCAGDAAADVIASAGAEAGGAGDASSAVALRPLRGVSSGSVPSAVALISARAPRQDLVSGSALDELVPRYLRGSDARRPAPGRSRASRAASGDVTERRDGDDSARQPGAG